MNLSFPPLSLLLLLSTFSSAADIPLGSSLHASDLYQNWSSPKSIFSLRFIPATPTSFSAVITFSQIPIWSAGGGVSSTLVDSRASLHFLASGNLRLVNGSGTILWESGTAGRGVSHAVLHDSGNLVLRNGNVSVWSTFDNPTDTIVPSQNFTTSNTLRAGSYSFVLTKIGNLALKWNNSIEYWNQGLNSSVNSKLTSPSLGIQSLGILLLADPMLSASIVMAYSSDYAEGEGSNMLRFMRLDSDGNLRIYSFDRSSGISNVRWTAVKDQCEVFGYCGNMGICSYNQLSPVCSCPSENFELVDPKDSTKGCKRKEEIENCPGRVTMLELQHAKFLTYPPDSPSQVFFLGILSCRLNCLMGRSCVASTSLSDGAGTCYMKVPAGFISGYQSPVVPSTSYMKVCEPVVGIPSASAFSSLDGRGADEISCKLRIQIVAPVVVGNLLVLVSLQVGLWWWCCRRKYCSMFREPSSPDALVEYVSGAPLRFSYKDLHRSTKGFKEKLGEGGFGAVYRGVLVLANNNRTIVAVKQLEGIEQGEKQFKMEVATISSTHHLNLARLIGFCSEGRHRLLVYEFMKNGSLDTFLFPREGEHSGRFLNWENRFSIALGAARGITYLHEECRECIVHCDIKPENILLDENYKVRVSDFGLAKLVNPKDHMYRIMTSVRGTRGYLAPEWLANLPITSKSDVYSYGMLLLEIVSGRRNFEVSEESNGKKFSLWAYEKLEKGSMEGIVDKRLADEGVMMEEEAKRAIQVSFWCIQEQPSRRPTMGKVVQMLEGISEIEMPPAPKAGIAGNNGNVTGSNDVVTVNSSSSSGIVTTFVSARSLEKSSSLFLAMDMESTSACLLKSAGSET